MISSKDITARPTDWYPGQVIPLPPPNPWDVGMVFFILGFAVGTLVAYL